MPPNDEKKDSNIDLNKILLPKKDPSPDSAQRINAGALLAQENRAAAEGLGEKSLTPSVSTPDGAPPPGLSSTPSAPPTPAPKPESSIKSIETYQGDIESLVEKKNVSTISIAAAEADRPKDAPTQPLPEFQTSSSAPLFTRTLMIVGGVVLLALAAGVVAYVLLTPHTVQVTPSGSVTPFITVDSTVAVPLAANTTRTEAMTALTNARKNTKIALGLIQRLYVTVPTGDTANSTKEIAAADLLTALSPYVPQELLRTLSPTYLLGVHSFDENEPFIILHTDSYETSYAAMLQWEGGMQTDLAPLFMRVPPVRLNTGGSSLPLATSSATSTASSSPVASGQTLNPAFVDRIVENKDARVIQTAQNDILLLWTFLDRNTIVITTNEYTLREIISRITRAPQTGLPQ